MKDYKKILKGIVNIINTTEKNDIGFANICTYISENCSELKENEDERIRKELICFLKTEIPHCNARDKYIAWLEKQDESNLIKEIKRKKDLLLNEKRKAISSKEKLSLGGRIAMLEELLVWLKYDITGIKSKHADGKLDEMIKKIKSTDKVEPKFKVGDWITDGYLHYKITDVLEDRYVVDTKFVNRSAILFNNESRYHLWTIQDAKDGDVIYSRHYTENFEWIGIFKSLDKENKRVFFYGFWHNIFKSFSVCRKEAYVLYNDFSPATKEQREQLEKAMAVAGFTFDFEKKELKKIENKSNL